MSMRVDFAQYCGVFCAKLVWGVEFVQYWGVFCAKLWWGVEFAQYLGVFCAKLGWEGVVVLKYCTFAENYREE